MSILAVKMLLKAIGLDAEKIEAKALDVQKVVLEFDVNELRSALQLILDYKKDQAQNTLRMQSILKHLGIDDPVGGEAAQPCDVADVHNVNEGKDVS